MTKQKMAESKNHDSAALRRTEQWLEQWVIGQGLCPFAQHPWQQGRVELRLSVAKTQDALLADLDAALQSLAADPQVETLLLVHPEVLQEFYDYNDFLDLADALIQARDWEGEFQIASFHPDYQFADTSPDAVENYTNRSPYPLLHILREGSVSAAIAHHPDVDQIPQRNIALLQQLGLAQVQTLQSPPIEPEDQHGQ